ILTWAATLFIVRFLAPADYGLVGMAALYLGLVQMLSDLGVGAAVITFRDLSPGEISQFNTLAVFTGALCVLLSYGAAVPLAHFFSEPRLAAIVRVMSLSYLIGSLRVVPLATMQRDLEFRRLALIDAGVSITGSCAAMAMAVAGFDYWTLAIAPLVNATVQTVLVVSHRPTRFGRPDLAAIRKPLLFSSHTLTTRFTWYTYSNADFFVIGRFMGKVALGTYTLGWTLSGLAVEKITALIGRVTPAFFASVQHDLPELKRYLLLVTEGLSFITFPTCIGIALVAPELVLVALGKGWTSAVAPLRLLAVLATLRSVQPLFPQVMSALGEARETMKNALLTVSVLPVAFYFATRWGIAGVATAWIALAPILFLPFFATVRRHIGMTVAEYISALWPAVSGCLVMTVAVLSIDRFMLGSASVFVSLIVKIAVGAAAYAGAMLLLHRRRLMTVRGVLKTLRSSAERETEATLTEAPNIEPGSPPKAAEVGLS
ncbi:MAG: lipopolysaccharide biosynthesis protein, partial [Gemmatimonadaceae bacterium]